MAVFITPTTEIRRLRRPHYLTLYAGAGPHQSYTRLTFPTGSTPKKIRTLLSAPYNLYLVSMPQEMFFLRLLRARKQGVSLYI